MPIDRGMTYDPEKGAVQMTDDFRIFSICNTQTICDEIAAGMHQKDIAVSYAMAIRSQANK